MATAPAVGALVAEMVTIRRKFGRPLTKHPSKSAFKGVRAEPTDQVLTLVPTDAPLDETWVRAAPFRALVRHVIDVAGVPWPAFAIESAVSVTVVHTLLFGRGGRPMSRLNPRIAARLLRVGPSQLADLRRIHVRADATAERLVALLAGGSEPIRLARWCDLTGREFDSLVSGATPSCSRLTETLAVAAERTLCAPVLSRRAA